MDFVGARTCSGPLILPKTSGTGCGRSSLTSQSGYVKIRGSRAFSGVFCKGSGFQERPISFVHGRELSDVEGSQPLSQAATV